MVRSSENSGAERAERNASEQKGTESSVHQEITQSRQTATQDGVQQKEQSKNDTNRLENQGQLPSLTLADQDTNDAKTRGMKAAESPDSAKEGTDKNKSGSPEAAKQTKESKPETQENKSEAAEMLGDFSISPESSSSAAGDDRTKVADSPVHPFNATASEYKDMLRSGPKKGIDRICSTDAQSPAVSKQEIQNTCGIDLKSKFPEVKAGVVQVYGEGGRIGTGFLACEKNNCQIVTDEHVVGSGTQVMLVKDGKAAPGTVTGRDSASDLASISFDAKRLPGLKPLPLGTGTDLAVGAPVFAVGHGKQLPEQSVIPGQITNASVDIKTRDGALYANQFDSDMKAVPGHSGSPVLDRDGKVVAVIGSSGRTGSSGPKVEKVKELLRKSTH